MRLAQRSTACHLTAKDFAEMWLAVMLLQGMVAGAKRSTRSTRRGGGTAEFYELDRDNLARIKVAKCQIVGPHSRIGALAPQGIALDDACKPLHSIRPCTSSTRSHAPSDEMQCVSPAGGAGGAQAGAGRAAAHRLGQPGARRRRRPHPVSPTPFFCWKICWGAT